jgi:hypothetical protein
MEHYDDETPLPAHQLIWETGRLVAPKFQQQPQTEIFL